MDDLLADFLTEASEGLAALDTALVKLERTPDDQAILGETFRIVHTIKGTCGFLGLPRLEKVAHAAENVLGKYRDGALKVTPDSITLILRAIDRIKMIITGLEKTEKEPEGDDETVISALNKAANGDLSGINDVAAPKSGPAPAPVQVASPAQATEVKQEITEAPATPAAAMHDLHDAVAEAVDPSAGPSVASQTIRVSVEVLEGLMTLVSELVLTRNQLMQLARNTENAGLSVPLQRLSHITSDLQEGVMKTRMQPIGNAWGKLPRLVRDLARDLSKKIDLVMNGQDTELDRQVLELIKDPLTHMVRNSADHGLETPEQRRASGKSETGKIMLNAFHEGGHIIIEIADDGRGLATSKIKKKAVENNLATEESLAAMTESQIQQFIFKAGFSTAAAVTSVSGRGVGMDVVKTNIEKIGGTIEMRSVEGKGTTFTVKIPLTLAIVSALIVEAGKERFAIPQIGVVELVRVGGATDSAIDHINDAPVLRLRDRLLPLVSLSSLLALDENRSEGDASFVVVTQIGAQLFGIVVDRVYDTEEIVVKPVAPILRHVTMFSGNTILGDGSVIMILDPNGIARATGVGVGSSSYDAENAKTEAAILADHRTGDKSALLLFRSGDEPTPKAVPLGLIARLEDIPAEKIEFSGGAPVTQYRGRLMPLVPMSNSWTLDPNSNANQAVLVFNDHEHTMGLMVDAILDVIEDKLDIELQHARPGYLGTAVIAGRATDIIDTTFWLQQANADWFSGHTDVKAGKQKILLVEDSPFFQQLVVPALSAAGYDVIAVGSAIHALKLRDAGIMFDAILSDIEMPGMDGFEFVRQAREDGAWASLPMIALTGRSSPEDAILGRTSGFSDYVAKYNREELLNSLSQCLSNPIAA